MTQPIEPVDPVWPIEGLVGAHGVVRVPRRVDTRGWLPGAVSMFLATSGDLGERPSGWPAPGGAGRSLDGPETARRLAICEAVERYSFRYSDVGPVTTASADELGSTAMALGQVARCSSAELSTPGCPLIAPRSDRQMRWVEGVDLGAGASRLVPLVMVKEDPHPLPAERFWLPISTGCALHRDAESASLAALLEVVERDAVAVAWLRGLALPRLPAEVFSPVVVSLIAWYAERDMTVHLFDATTDLGIPVVYCVIDAPEDPSVVRVVGSACSFDIALACEKAVLEAGALRMTIATETVPTRLQDFDSPTQSAALMARPEQSRAFDFLLEGIEDRVESRPPVHGHAWSPRQSLKQVLAVLDGRGFDAYAVDLTPREARAFGYRVVRAIIPQLQPLSVMPMAQFHGHPRLTHDHPAAATSRFAAATFNPWPQPMS